MHSSIVICCLHTVECFQVLLSLLVLFAHSFIYFYQTLIILFAHGFRVSSIAIKY